jgi:hypothetical protein
MNKAVVAKGTALRTVRFAAQFSEFRKLMDSGNSAKASRDFPKGAYEQMLRIYYEEDAVRRQLVAALSGGSKNSDFLLARQEALADRPEGVRGDIRRETIALVQQNAGPRKDEGSGFFREALYDALHAADTGK